MTKAKLTLTCIVAILFLAITNTGAQTKNEAIIAFNDGVRMEKADSVKEAIVAFEKSVTISEQVGDSATEVKNLAIQEIPKLYYLNAKSLATEKKWTEATTASKNAIKVAEKYNNDKYKDPSQKLLGQCYFILGGNCARNKENENAIKYLDSTLSINPDNIKAYYFKVVVYKNMENFEKFLETGNITVEKAKAENDTATVNQITKMTGEYYAKNGIKNIKAKQYSEAITNFNNAIKYNFATKDVFYYLATAYNQLKKYDEALTNANKGLEMETGVGEPKAKYYFEIATAQVGKGDNENACANYKKANYGRFVTAVKAQLTNLKCK
jgi:tetratricopeptide (TPR) repeat protein